MITLKKLNSGGEEAVKKMMEDSAVLGTEIIELIWTPDNGLPRNCPAEVNGYDVPIFNRDVVDIGTDISVERWIEGNVTFYDDNNGRCWGYVFDTLNNRKKLYNSFSNGWFRIVDKKIRDEIASEAEALNIPLGRPDRVELNVKKTTREKAAESKAKNLESKLEEMNEKMKKLQEELLITKGEKADYVNKRLKGVKVPNREDALDDKKD